MKRILGLDLGTASIGWVIKEKSNSPSRDDIVEKGVVIFPEGFGSEKGNQFSLAAKRTEKRQIRRQLYRRKLRKYAVLNILIQNQMVPLSKEELRAWIKPDKGKKPEYPTNPRFLNWTRLISTDGESAFANIYELRRDGLEGNLSKYLGTGFSEKELLGRIFYNYAQRRGFKSNAKNQEDAESGKVKKSILELEAELNGRFLAQYFAELNPLRDRIRSRYTSREQYVREFEAVCNSYAEICDPIRHGLEKALFTVRPLKSQKDKVGSCSFEAGKKRIHLSHPLFEEFRLWQFLQNVRIQVGKGKIEGIPVSVIEKLVSKISSEKTEQFTKAELNKWLKLELGEGVKISSNNKFPARACPSINALISLLGQDWKNKTFLRTYQKGKTEQYQAHIGWEELWHFLKETQEKPEKFALDRPRFKYALELGFEEEKAEQFEAIQLTSGYGALSAFAIKAITPFMKEGYPYHIAVLLAGMKRVLGLRIWTEKGEEITNRLMDAEQDFEFERSEAKAYNYFLENLKNHGEIPDSKSIKGKLKFFIGKERWKEIIVNAISLIETSIENVNVRLNEAVKDPENCGFLPAPSLQRLVETIVKEELAGKGIKDEKVLNGQLAKLYHHSAISKWKPVQFIEVLESGTGEPIIIPQLQTPYTGAIQNPAAMRALHELKKLINYLLRERLISTQDVVRIEMARELNDSNKRKAIQEWQEKQEAERQRIRHFLVEQMKEANPSEDQIQKMRMWLEQIDHASGEIDRQNLDKQFLGSALKKIKSDTIVKKLELWKEQKGICLYSGRQLSISDVLYGQVEIEHTIPRSLSNDSRMQNLTLAYGPANRLKGNRIPSEITPEQGIDEPEIIRSRLKPWEDRIEYLEGIIRKKRSPIRRAKNSGDKERYDSLIKDRWLLRFERDYWRDKVNAFYLEEVDQRFARRQLVDTQVITKYSIGWLKTAFHHVIGTKGSLTASLRKLWGLQSEYEKKDRTQHTHHLIDALIVASIEPSTYRQLTEYYRQTERKKRPWMPKPWEGFTEDALSIAESVLVYHVNRDRYKVQTKKKRKDGSYTHGEGYRAKLHKETVMGLVRYQDLDDAGNTKWGRDEKGAIDTVFTTRKSSSDEKIKPVFEKLNEYISEGKERLKTDQRIMPVKSLLNSAGKKIEIASMSENDLPLLKNNEVNSWFLEEVKEKGLETVRREGFFLPIRKIRVRTAAASPISLKKYPKAFRGENNPAKHHVYVVNDGNYALAIYRNNDGKKEKRTFLIRNHLETAIQESEENLFPSSVEVKGKEYYLEGQALGPQIFTIGKRVLLFEETPNEIWDQMNEENLKYRLFNISGLSSMTIKSGKNQYPYGTINLLLNFESGKMRNQKGEIADHKLHKGVYKAGEKFAKRMFLHTQINALIEDIDFRINYLGEIERL